MPEWWPKLLLLVFATHLPFFALRWRRTRERRFAATTLTFALLVLTYALRVFAPELRVSELPLWQVLRAGALASAVVSVGWLVGHGVGRWRARRLAQVAGSSSSPTGN